MHLAEFIEQKVDSLVDDWESFARTSIESARSLAPAELRDHARLLLVAVVTDLKLGQDVGAKYDKSRGDLPRNSPQVTETAHAHARHRFTQNFSLCEMVSEYRALRASVIQGWTETGGPGIEGAVEEVVRFGETMDQGLTESIAWYVGRVDESRALLLGVLGHDMRTPLAAVAMSAQYLLQSETLDGQHMRAVARIIKSTGGLRTMVNDLLDFTQTSLGVALPIAAATTDVAEIGSEVVEELRALHPDRALDIRCIGDCVGLGDAARIGQMMSNLVSNAIHHGARDMPISVTVMGAADAIELRVNNGGQPIATDAVGTLFEPLSKSAKASEDRHLGSSGLGLGLYIAREIALAHGGSIEVESNEVDGTTFIAKLPRTGRIERRQAQK